MDRPTRKHHVALLWWIARDPSIRAQLAELPTPPEPGWLLPAWLAGGVNELAGAPRWWLCLRIAGIPLGFPHAAGLHFLGLFTSLFLPGRKAGEPLHEHGEHGGELPVPIPEHDGPNGFSRRPRRARSFTRCSSSSVP